MIALKDDPYEPVETVEAVVQDIMRAGYVTGCATIPEIVARYVARVRAARDAEVGGGE